MPRGGDLRKDVSFLTLENATFSRGLNSSLLYLKLPTCSNEPMNCYPFTALTMCFSFHFINKYSRMLRNRAEGHRLSCNMKQR